MDSKALIDKKELCLKASSKKLPFLVLQSNCTNCISPIKNELWVYFRILICHKMVFKACIKHNCNNM